MSKVHPLVNFPFKVTLKDGTVKHGTVKHAGLLSYTHGNIVTLSLRGGFDRVSLDEIDTIEVDKHETFST